MSDQDPGSRASDQDRSSGRRSSVIPGRFIATMLLPVATAVGSASIIAHGSNERASEAPQAGNVPGRVAKVPTYKSDTLGVEVPKLIAKPGIKQEDLPPSLQPQVTVTVKPGQGAEDVVREISPEELSGPNSTQANRQAQIDHVQSQGLGPNHELQANQTVTGADPHPGYPSPQLPEDLNTHVG